MTLLMTPLLTFKCGLETNKSNNNSGNKHFDRFIFTQLLLTSTIWFSLDRKQWRCKRSLKKIETFWFFQLQFHCANVSSYDLVFFLFTWQGHKNSYDSDFVVFGRLENSIIKVMYNVVWNGSAVSCLNTQGSTGKLSSACLIILTVLSQFWQIHGLQGHETLK